MANLLIVVEDIVKIQTFSGRLGKTYSKIYQILFNLKLKLIIARYCRQNHVTLLASDNFRPGMIKVITYDQELSRVNLLRLNPLAWQILDEINQKITRTDKKFCEFKSIPLIKLWENKLAVKLIYDYLVYFDLIRQKLGSGEFDAVIILDQSIQSEAARYYTKKFNLKLINYSRINLNFITHKLVSYFRYREINTKIKQFINLSGKPSAKVSVPKNSIFLSVDFPRHLSTLSPVYKYFKQNRLRPRLISTLPALPQYLSHFNLTGADYCFLNTWLPDDEIGQLPAWKKRTDCISRKIAADIRRLPENFNGLVGNLFAEEILPVIKSGLILSKLYLLAGDNFFQATDPRGVIIVANTRPLELALALMAKHYHKFSLMISNRTIMFPGEPYLYQETEKISVTGNYVRDKLIKIGINPQKIAVDGDPRFEDWQPGKAAVYKKLGIKDLSKKIVLLISFRPNQQISPGEKKEFIELSRAAVKELGRTVLVIKPHPTEKKYQLEADLKQWQINDVIIADNSQLELFSLLSVAAAVLQTWSMTGLEAMIFNRPVVIVNPTQKDYDRVIPYLAGGGALAAKNKAELAGQLQQLFHKHQPAIQAHLTTAKNFAAGYIRIPDGKVCQRISRHFNRS